MTQLNMFDYLNLSARTASGIETPRRDVFKTDGDVCKTLVPLIAASQMADCMKRSIFYNESVEKTKQRGETGAMNLKLLLEELETMTTQNPERLLGKTRIDIIHAALGTISEAGEILDEILQSIIQDRPIDLTNLREEFGDQLWYQALGLRAVDSTFEDEAFKNIEKLKIRYPNQFTSENALERDLQAEKVALK